MRRRVCAAQRDTTHAVAQRQGADGALLLLEYAARAGSIAVLECLLEEGLLSCGDLAVPCCRDGNVFHLALHCSVFLQRLRAFHAYAWQWCGCVGDEEEQLVRALELDDTYPIVLDCAIDRNVDDSYVVGPARQVRAHCLQLVAGWVRSKRPQQPYTALWRCGVAVHHTSRRVLKLVSYPFSCGLCYALEHGDYCCHYGPHLADDSPITGCGPSRPQRSRRQPNRTQYLRRLTEKRRTQDRAYMRSAKCDLLL